MQKAHGVDILQQNKRKLTSKNRLRSQKKCSKKKRFWTEEEDKILEVGVYKYGRKKWSQISKLLKDRHPKRCRQRWFNYLSQNNQSWNGNDLWLLYLAYKNLGNKWSQISKLLNRGDNIVKNKITCLKRNGIDQFQEKLKILKIDEKMISQLPNLQRKLVKKLIKKQQGRQDNLKVENNVQQKSNHIKLNENQCGTRQRENIQLFPNISSGLNFPYCTLFPQYFPTILPLYMPWNIYQN